MTAMASHEVESFVAEYRTPKQIRTWGARPRAEVTTTAVAIDVRTAASLMRALSEQAEFNSVLNWASSREDMPEYPDPAEVVAERQEFLVSISAALLESIERRSG
jgi:hypothetical protein